MNPLEIINEYYLPQPELREILLTHSESVARKALAVLRDSAVEADENFVWEAAMLHDIGIIRTHAPGIKCFGSLPYICHGIEGSRMLREHELPLHALVCERHTGSGLTVEDIVAQNLPLPRRDMVPVSIEEKLICYADKFFSKSGDLKREKGLDEVRRSLARHGEAALERFDELHGMFSPL